MRNLAGRTGERRGCRIEEIRWDPLEQPPLPQLELEYALAVLGAWAGLWSHPDWWLPRTQKPAGRGGPGGLPSAFAPGCGGRPTRDGAMLHGRSYVVRRCCRGRSSGGAHRLRSHTDKGAARCHSQTDSASWDRGPSGFPRLASRLLHCRLGRYYAVGRFLLGSLELLMQLCVALCCEALVFSHVSLHRRDGNSTT